MRSPGIRHSSSLNQPWMKTSSYGRIAVTTSPYCAKSNKVGWQPIDYRFNEWKVPSVTMVIESQAWHKAISYCSWTLQRTASLQLLDMILYRKQQTYLCCAHGTKKLCIPSTVFSSTNSKMEQCWLWKQSKPRQYPEFTSAPDNTRRVMWSMTYRVNMTLRIPLSTVQQTARTLCEHSFQPLGVKSSTPQLCS